MTDTQDVKYRTKTIRYVESPGRYDLMITLMEAEASELLRENGYHDVAMMYTLLSSGTPQADYDYRRLGTNFPEMLKDFLRYLERDPRERFESLTDDSVYDHDEVLAKIEAEWNESI